MIQMQPVKELLNKSSLLTKFEAFSQIEGDRAKEGKYFDCINQVF